MIYFLHRGELPWHQETPHFSIIDPKDPLCFKKRMQQDRKYQKYLAD